MRYEFKASRLNAAKARHAGVGDTNKNRSQYVRRPAGMCVRIHFAIVIQNALSVAIVPACVHSFGLHKMKTFN